MTPTLEPTRSSPPGVARGTAADALASGAAALARGEVEAPRRAAEILLADALGITREQLLARPERMLDSAAAERYRALLERHARGEPLAYVRGRREFYGLEFEVSPAVLIPRPETEVVVERAVEHTRRAAAGRPLLFADVGAGSGCIAIAFASEVPRARGWGIDLDPRALALAARNAARHGVAGRIAFVAGDLLAPIADGPVLDLIVSNPPYVARGDAALARSVREHEPEIALFGGDTGLDVYRRLVPQAAARLASGGILALEIGIGQADEVRNLVETAGLEPVEVAPDLQGIARCVVARRVG